MRATTSSSFRRPALVVAVLLVLGACATPPKPTLPPAPPPPPELNVASVCQLVVDADDAAARGSLVSFRHEAEGRGAKDRHAVFAMHLAEATAEARFRSFHSELTNSPDSLVGPLGECLVYAGWPKMGPQAMKACAAVAERLGRQKVLADIGLASSALVHDGDSTRALTLAEAGLKAAPGCGAFVVLKARARAAADARAAPSAWADAVTALPGCFRCLAEAAAAEERVNQGPAGRASAAALWERALAIAPEHPDTLRRFAAATAGVDDARALTAYADALKAGARDYPTLLAAARLATTLALASTAANGPDGAIEQALDFARRATDAARADPEPRRLVLQLLVKKGAWDDVIVAGDGLLDIEDDALAHLALARAKLAGNDVVGAVRHYDNAVRVAALGSPLDDASAAALTTERTALLARLLVDPAKASKGGANTVAANTQKQLQALWRERVKKKAVTKGGDLVVVAETDATGQVVDVDIKSDGVGDPDLAGAAIAWLSRATVQGGARRYTMEFAVR